MTTPCCRWTSFQIFVMMDFVRYTQLIHPPSEFRPVALFLYGIASSRAGTCQGVPARGSRHPSEVSSLVGTPVRTGVPLQAAPSPPDPAPPALSSPRSSPPAVSPSVPPPSAAG